MNRPRSAVASHPPARPLAALLLLGVAAALAARMAISSLNGGGLAGCGPGSGCDQVLSSKWAYFFGMPVSVGGLLAYVGLIASAIAGFGAKGLPGARAGAVVLSGVAIAAALWFYALQLWAVKAFCVYCSVTHLLAAAGAVLILARANGPANRSWRLALAGLAAIPLLYAGQSASSPKTHAEVSYNQAKSASNPAANPPTPISGMATPPAAAPTPAAVPAPRMLPVLGGSLQLDLSQVPIWGNPAAPHVVVSLFDYTCHHCRDMHFMLASLLARHSNSLAVVSLPMPLDANCNPLVSQTPPAHQGACDYARLGLAVWLADAGKLHKYDEYIFGPERPPGIAEATKRAEQLVGAEILAKMVNDPRVERQIQGDVALYRANSQRAQRGQMPQLIFPGGTVVGSVASEAELAKIFNQHFPLDPPAAPPAPAGQTTPPPPPL